MCVTRMRQQGKGRWLQGNIRSQLAILNTDSGAAARGLEIGELSSPDQKLASALRYGAAFQSTSVDERAVAGLLLLLP